MIFGWSRLPAALASCTRRSACAAWSWSLLSTAMVLSATVRPISRSWALYTTPTAPRPSSDWISYRLLGLASAFWLSSEAGEFCTASIATPSQMNLTPKRQGRTAGSTGVADQFLPGDKFRFPYEKYTLRAHNLVHYFGFSFPGK